MKSKLLVIFTIFLSMALFVNTADARRFGGGRSFGKTWTAPSHRDSSSSSFFSKNVSKGHSNLAAKTQRGSLLKGMFMGLVAGGLLSALFSGSAFQGLQGMDILIFVIIAFALFRLYQWKKSSENAYAGSKGAYQRENIQREQSQSNIYRGLSSDSAKTSPSWFNEAKFVKGAKTHFLTLQKAWDENDLITIQSYCAPELYQLISNERMEYAGKQHTQVLSLNAKLLDIAEEDNLVIAAIEFEAVISSNNQPNERVREVWSIQHEKAHGHGDWLIVGIEQR